MSDKASYRGAPLLKKFFHSLRKLSSLNYYHFITHLFIYISDSRSEKVSSTAPLPRARIIHIWTVCRIVWGQTDTTHFLSFSLKLTDLGANFTRKGNHQSLPKLCMPQICHLVYITALLSLLFTHLSIYLLSILTCLPHPLFLI